jgi:hypothetical protein
MQLPPPHERTIGATFFVITSADRPIRLLAESRDLPTEHVGVER